MSFASEAVLAVIAAGVPGLVAGWFGRKIHRQTKMSNGVTLAHTVEKIAARQERMEDRQETMGTNFVELIQAMADHELEGHAQEVRAIHRSDGDHRPRPG